MITVHGKIRLALPAAFYKQTAGVSSCLANPGGWR